MAKQVCLIIKKCDRNTIEVIKEYVSLGISFICLDDANRSHDIHKQIKAVLNGTKTTLIINKKMSFIENGTETMTVTRDRAIKESINTPISIDVKNVEDAKKAITINPILIMISNIFMLENKNKNILNKINKMVNNIVISGAINCENILKINPSQYQVIAASSYLLNAKNKHQALEKLRNSDLRYIKKNLDDIGLKYSNLKLINGGSSNNTNATFFVDEIKNVIKIFQDTNKLKTEYNHLKNQSIKIRKGKTFVYRKFVEENNNKILRHKDTKRLIEAIKKLHAQKPISNYKFDYDAYDELIDQRVIKKYLRIKKWLISLPQVQIHGDINRGNILILKDDVVLIDFEWASIGAAIIDYAYMALFMPETITQIKNKQLSDAIFFIKNHTVGWAKKMNTKKSNDLLKQMSYTKNEK